MIKDLTIKPLGKVGTYREGKDGFQLSGNCGWEEEHGIEIDILDGKLVYLGEYVGESPWRDHSKESWNCATHA